MIYIIIWCFDYIASYFDYNDDGGGDDDDDNDNNNDDDDK